LLKITLINEVVLHFGGPSLTTCPEEWGPLQSGLVWTTDAPYRETEEAISEARDVGVIAVEMEAAVFYAFAEARAKDVLCFAHVTNQMARIEGDFEKGENDGSNAALAVVAATARAWRKTHPAEIDRDRI
jgi:purine-nucleoside phosphorylase